MNYDEEISRKAYAEQNPEIIRAAVSIDKCLKAAQVGYPELSPDGQANIAAAIAIITELHEVEEHIASLSQK